MSRVEYLSTRQLAVGYVRRRRVIRLFEDLNLSLAGGSMVCFMGPNGAGKSSLLRTLAGLQKPLKGRVVLPGERGDKVSSHIAVVLTDRISAVNLTVAEIIAFGRYPYLGWNIRLTDADKRIIDRAIEQVHLGSLLNKRLYELSDGQLQMAMIARALAQDTPVILLDEPTAHLDLNNRVEIMDLLLRLARDTGKAILLATHELDLALQTADLIWLTGKERNILTGLPEDLVLNGSFDEIFQLKGFDLKTGRVQHQPFRKCPVRLVGEGPAYLWTKNALERNGFGISQDERRIVLSVISGDSGLKWLAETNEGTKKVVFEANSIESVLNLLEQTIAAKHS